MNCACGDVARFFVGRDGKPGYCCPHHRCKFYAVTPIQCDGYHRVMTNAQTPPETVIIRFEALTHPESTAESPAMAVLATFQGNLYGREEVVRVLHDTEFRGAWYPAKEAYLYTDWAYPRLVTALRRVPHVLVEEVPPFFFRCVTRLQQVVTQHSEAVAAGTTLDVDPEDAVYTQLKPFQKRGVDFVVAHDGRGLIADDMGLGKTVQAIAVAHLYRQEWPVLVMCPMSLMENWMKEFNKFAGVPYARMVVLQGTKARVSDLHDVVIVSYSSLKCLDNVTFNVVIADESHYIKSGEAKRAQQALRLCRSAHRVVLLSGTPAMARPLELYTQLQSLQPSLVPSKTQYGARYCNAHVSRFGVDMTGHSHTDELNVLLRHFMIRRTKKELGNELPSKTRQLLYVFITDREKKALEKQVMALRRSIAGHPDGMGQQAGGDYASRAPNAFELKIATAQAKIPAVRDYVMSTVEQHLDSGEKIIFFAHHQCMMEALRSAVEAVRPKRPIDYIFIAGDTPGPQREQLANHFREEPSCGVAVLSMQSSGTGHNFTCASTVVFAELDWNPSTHLQCEDRVHRLGQSNPCSIKYLLAEGTSDSVIWPMLQAKLSVTSAMFAAHGADGADGAAHQLTANANLQKVSRRDLSENADGGTQGTLDGFLKPSQRSPRSSTTSTSTPTGPSTRAAVHDEDEVVLMEGGTGPGGPRGLMGGGEAGLAMISATPMLTPPSRGTLHAAVPPSPPPATPPPPPPATQRVVVPIAEYEQQRSAKASAAAAFRQTAGTVTVTSLAASAGATTATTSAAARKSAEPKTSVLDLMRTSPVTHPSAEVSIAPPVVAVPAAPVLARARTIVHIGGHNNGGSAPHVQDGASTRAPAPLVQAPLVDAPQMLPMHVASLLSATTTTGVAAGAGAVRPRTTFSFAKGPACVAPGPTTVTATEPPHCPVVTASNTPQGAPRPVVGESAPSQPRPAPTTVVTRVSIPVGFKRRHDDGDRTELAAPLARSPVRGPRREAVGVGEVAAVSHVISLPLPPPPPPMPIPMPIPMYDAATAGLSAPIVFDPAHLSATVPLKPRKTFVLHSQKPNPT